MGGLKQGGRKQEVEGSKGKVGTVSNPLVRAWEYQSEVARERRYQTGAAGEACSRDRPQA